MTGLISNALFSLGRLVEDVQVLDSVNALVRIPDPDALRSQLARVQVESGCRLSLTVYPGGRCLVRASLDQLPRMITSLLRR